MRESKSKCICNVKHAVNYLSLGPMPFIINNVFEAVVFVDRNHVSIDVISLHVEKVDADMYYFDYFHLW